MEESADQILSTLAVIHRFMSAHTSLQDNLQGSMANVNVNPPADVRARTLSETDNPNTLHVVSRKLNIL